MRLERMADKAGDAVGLAPMCVSERAVVMADGGGEYFVSVTREEVARLLAVMDAEKARAEAEDWEATREMAR